MHPIKHLRPRLLGMAVLVALAFPVQAKESTTSSALNAQLFYEILLGELSVRANDDGSGFALMLDAARRTQSPDLFRRAVDIALRSRAGTSALAAARAWTQSDTHSAEAQRYLLQILLGLNQPKEAQAPLVRLLELTPDKEKADLIWSISSVFEHASDKRQAVFVVENALDKFKSDMKFGPSAWATIARMWINAADSDQALQAITKGHTLDPAAQRPMLVAMSLLDGQNPKVEELLRAYVPGADPEFRLRYARALLNQQRIKEAQAELTAMLSQYPDYAEAWLVQGLVSEATGQSEQAQEQLLTYLKLTDPAGVEKFTPEIRRARAQAYMGLAQISEKQKDWARAESWLALADNPQDAMRVGIRRGQLLARQNKVEDALSLIEQQQASNAEEARLKLNATVQILRDSKQFERARALLVQMLERNPGETESIYTLAMVHERMGDLAEMEKLLRQIIALKPEDSSAYNALGYSLADRGERLPEALALIRKALALSPNDPFITDSLGWAEFRSGNLDEAIRLLSEAFRSRPDAEIAAHLGEALWTKQQRTQAVDIFRQGMELNNQNETLLETIKRLNVSL